MQLEQHNTNNRPYLQNKLNALGVPHNPQAPLCVLASLYKKKQSNYIECITAMQGTPWEIVSNTPAFWLTFTDIRIMGVLPQVSKMFRFVSQNQLPWEVLSKTVRRVSKAYACKIFLLSYKHLNNLSYLLHKTALGVFAHLITLQDAYATAMQVHKTPVQLLQKRRLLSGWCNFKKTNKPYPTNFFITKQYRHRTKIKSKQKLQFRVNMAILKQRQYRTYFNLPKLTQIELDDIDHIVRMAHK